MKITFEFGDDPKELEIKKAVRSFYKAYFGAIEGRFDENDEEEAAALAELKQAMTLEVDGNRLSINFDLNILDDSDIEEFKSDVVPGMLKGLL